MKSVLITIKENSFRLSLLWTAIIFGLCSMPGRYIPTTNWLELISFDKFVHASIFFVLQFLWMLSFPNQKWWIFILCVAYGGSIELMQANIFSQRSADWFDFIANSFGCIIALAFFRKISLKFFP